MTWFSSSAPTDEASDASRFLSRIGYVVLALATPAAVLHPLAIYVLFAVGVVLICLATMLDPPGNLGQRLRRALSSPAALAGLAGLAWAALSILWTPFAVAAAQHVLKLAAWTIAIIFALSLPREHARATDLYLFPIALLLTMALMLTAWIARRQGVAALDDISISTGGVGLATLLFPTMGGLAARGRNGYARLLLILAFVFAVANGSTPTIVALFVGFTALSFALSDLDRTSRDLSWLAGGLVLLAPGVALLVEPTARWIMHAKLPTLPPPFPTIALASSFVKHDWIRLLTGHGFESVVRGIRDGVLPPPTPRALLFEIWYELGIVGGAIAAVGAWFGFRAIGAAPARLAPYLAAAFACNFTLASQSEDLSDMTWLTMLAIALVVADIAARSQYRTTRPSGAHLAHL